MAARVIKSLQRFLRGPTFDFLKSKTETRPSTPVKHNGSNASAINPLAQCPRPRVTPPRKGVVYERKKGQKVINAISSIEKKTAMLKRKRAEMEDIDGIRESNYKNWTVENAVSAFGLSLSVGVLTLNGCEEVTMSDVPLPRDKDGDVELADAPPLEHNPQPGEKRPRVIEEAEKEPSKSARCNSWIGCEDWALYQPQNVIPMKDKPARYLDKAICLRANAPQREDDMRPMKISRPNWYHCRDPPAVIDACGSEPSTPEFSPEEPTSADPDMMDGIDELTQLPPPLAMESAHMQQNAAPTALEKAMLAAKLAHNTQAEYEMQEERRTGLSQPHDDTKSDDSSQSNANKKAQAELSNFGTLFQRLDIGPLDHSTSSPHGTGTQGAGDAEQVEIEKAPWEEQKMSKKQIKHKMLRMINESAEKLEAMKNNREKDLERRDVYTRISKLMVHWAHIADFAFEKIQSDDIAAGCSSVRYGKIDINKIDCAWTEEAAQGGQMFRRIILGLDSLLDKSASNPRLSRKIKDFDKCVSAVTDRIGRFNSASAQVKAMDPKSLENMIRAMKASTAHV